MEAAVLFLVILGGFQLSTRWTKTRFEILREDGHKLYFKSAYYGICIFLATYASVLLIEGAIGSVKDGRLYALSVDRAISANELIILAAVLTLFVGRYLPVWLNARRDPQQDLQFAIQDDDFEKFLHRAAVRRRLVSITMANRKIYVGWILETMDPTNERKHITLLPLFSGYRDEDGKTEITTKYDEIYAEMNNDETAADPDDDRVSADDFRVVLPVARVESANYFDLDVYKRFNPGADLFSKVPTAPGG